MLYRKQSLDETMIADSSRSLCSVTVAPSLSLGNIQGATARIEMKKQRAPPLPVIPSFSVGKAEREGEKKPSAIPQSSLQQEIKKKKRRAPLPPTPKMPNRFEFYTHNNWCTDSGVAYTHCSADVGFSTVICRPFCLPGEIPVMAVTAVCIPPDANVGTALEPIS